MVQGARLWEVQALLVKRRARQVHLQLILQVAAKFDLIRTVRWQVYFRRLCYHCLLLRRTIVSFGGFPLLCHHWRLLYPATVLVHVALQTGYARVALRLLMLRGLLLLLGDGDCTAECVLTCGGVSTKRDVFHRVSLRFHPVGGV